MGNGSGSIHAAKLMRAPELYVIPRESVRQPEVSVHWQEWRSESETERKGERERERKVYGSSHEYTMMATICLPHPLMQCRLKYHAVHWGDTAWPSNVATAMRWYPSPFQLLVGGASIHGQDRLIHPPTPYLLLPPPPPWEHLLKLATRTCHSKWQQMQTCRNKGEHRSQGAPRGWGGEDDPHQATWRKWVTTPSPNLLCVCLLNKKYMQMRSKPSPSEEII